MTQTIDDALEMDYGALNEKFIRADELREALADSIKNCTTVMKPPGPGIVGPTILCKNNNHYWGRCQACQRILKLMPSVKRILDGV